MQAIEYYKYELRLFVADLEASDPDSMYRVLRLALHCVQPHPRDRPSMAAAVDMLTGKRELSDSCLVKLTQAQAPEA